MPTRDNLSTARIVQNNNGSVYNMSWNKSLGMWQSISALNNAGVFVAGKYRNNAVSITKFTALSSPGFCTMVNSLKQTGSISGDIAAAVASATSVMPLASTYGYYTPWDSVAAGHSLQKALASTNEADLDVGVMLGELRETLAGLLNPLTALRSYAKIANKLAKSGKRPRASDKLDMLSGSWLEWRYGIMPLIYSIQDIIEHVNEQALLLQGKMLREKSRVKIPNRKYVVTGSQTPGSWTISGETVIEVETQFTSVVFYKLTRPLSTLERYGMDLASLPGIAWELATLSFVWDWFFSVGDWLGSLKTSDARQMLGSCTSQKSTVVATSKVSSARWLTTGTTARPVQCQWQCTYEKLDRRINQPVPLGPLVNREALSLKRQIDALTLLWGRIPKIRR